MAGIEEFLGTSEGMECILNNVGKDDDTISVQGVDWFKFNGTVASTVYVSGNMWMGFGVSSEQLKPYKRDGKVWSIYRQEATVDGTAFLKIRWEGYTNFGFTSSAYRLIYEHFMFGDGRMFLNVVQAPTSSKHLGTSTLVCGSNTYQMTLGLNDGCPYRYLFTPSDADATSWTLEAGVLPTFEAGVLPTFATVRYLLRKDGVAYTCDGTQLDGVTVSAAAFLRHGSAAAPTSGQITSLTGCEVLKWSSDTQSTPTYRVETTGTVQFPQRVMLNVDVSDSTILGISSASVDYDGDVRVRISTDRGASWADEMQLSGLASMDMTALWQSLQDGRMLSIEVLLNEGGIVREIKFHFTNDKGV